MPLSQRKLREINRSTQDTYANRNGKNGMGRQDNVWVVQGGDNMAKIAREVYGNERMLAEIIRLNGGVKTIRPGMVLKLPQAKNNRDIFFSNEWAANMGMATVPQLQDFYKNNPNSSATYAFNNAGYGWKNSIAGGGQGIAGLGVPGGGGGSDTTGGTTGGTTTLPAGPLGAPAAVKPPFVNSNANSPFQTPYGMQNNLPTPASLGHSLTPFGVPPGQPPAANPYGDRYDRNSAPAPTVPQGAPKVQPSLAPGPVTPRPGESWEMAQRRALQSKYAGPPVIPQQGQPAQGQPTQGLPSASGPAGAGNRYPTTSPQELFGLNPSIPLAVNIPPETAYMVAPYVRQALDALVYSGSPGVSPTITKTQAELLVQAGVIVKDSQDYKDMMNLVSQGPVKNPFDLGLFGPDTTTTTDTTGTSTDVGNGFWDPMNLGTYGKMPVQMRGKGQGRGGGGGGAPQLADYAGSVQNFGPSLGMHQWRGL